VIPVNQPQKRLLRTLLDRETPLEEAFLQEVRKAKAYNEGVGEGAPKKSYGFYDINAWSLPLAYGVESYWTEDVVTGNTEPVTARPAFSFAAPARARFAYLFNWNSQGATRLVCALWKEKYQIALAREPFTSRGRAFSPGTAVVRTLTNPASLHDRIVALAKEYEVELVAADAAMVDTGRDLGDRSVVDLEVPAIAVVSEPPTSATAFGAIWFLLEKRYGVPFTAIKGQDLGSADLSKYNVIVLPDGQSGGYSRTFGTVGAERLKRWVEGGGTLVAIKGAAAWAAGERVGLTTARDKFAQPPIEEGKKDDAAKKEPPRRIDTVPGAFVQVDLDVEHFIATGMESPMVALFRSNVVFTPSKRGAEVGKINKERPLVSGFAFDEGPANLKGAPFAWHEPSGRGHVILFADDVTFRTFLHGAHRIFLNTILLSPSM
jgi:hypothetical protein